MDQYIGKFLDNRYELLEVIGTGGMAVVYKARCHRLNRLVAVKVLKADLAQDAEFRRRFHDESQAVAMLSHPNIVAVYDVSHSDDLDYIVMELIDGITLKQYMQKKGPALNWREALHFITQIMRALSHAHSRGIIHRDIKPHNIMVLRDGSVKVSDFGIARITSAHQSTLTQEALGSVHYISPEQARGSHIDTRSDIYSAGVVLYEMITGRLPFEGESPVAVAIQHINSIPLSPRELDPELPEALEAITMKAMCPDPDQRYLSADEMLADLEEFRKNPNINFDYTTEDLKIGGEPTRPVPVGPIATGGEEPPRPRHSKPEEENMDDYNDRGDPIWPIVLAAGAILVFIIGIVVFLLTFKDLFFPSTPTDPSPSPSVEASLDPSQEEVTIPEEIVNAEARTAKLRLDHLGIEYDEVEDNSDTVTAGRIIKTIPAAGQSVKKGTKITLVKSAGPKVVMTTLTDMTGWTEEKVRRELKDMELEFVKEPSDQPESQVLGWKVEGQAEPNFIGEVPQGTKVSLTISAGAEASPSPSEVPSGQPTGIPMETPTPTPPASEEPATPTPPPAVNRKAIFVHLPSGMEEKSTVQVRIEVDGKVEHDESHETFAFPISPLVPGRGTQQVSVYVDNVLEEQYMQTFS